MKISTTETNKEHVIRVPKTSLKYLDFFLGLKCAPLLLESRFYPNAKEISETIGVFDKARIGLGLNYQNPNICMICVGDGHYPRTGFYASYMTQWQIHSVDPAMKENWSWIQQKVAKTKRLVLHPEPIEASHFKFEQHLETLVLVFVHSHASLSASMQSIERSFRQSVPALDLTSVRIHAVSLPCCVDDDLGRLPSTIIEDEGILSVCRSIQIYKDLKFEGTSV